MDDQELLTPDGLTWSYGTNLANDPESLPFSKTILFNSSTTVPSWLVYDLVEFDFSVVSSSNNIAGVHNISVSVDDGYNTPVSSSFTLTILENSAPQKLQSIPNYSIVNYNLLLIEFNPIDELFEDPDGRPMTADIIQANGDPLPSFLAYNSVANTISGTPESAHVRDWVIAYIVIDDYGLESNITFTITVKPWYLACQSWEGEGFDQWTVCKDGYFLQYSQCKTKWSGSAMKNYDTKQWEDCHEFWEVWTDLTSTGCPVCKEGYFSLGTSCYETCPDGYYNDYSTYQCIKWHEACTKWFGPTTKQCTECNSTLLYLLADTECQFASWLVGHYLNTTDLQWYPCDEGCNVCEYPDIHTWYRCNSIYKELTPGTCTHWDYIYGHEINEFAVCSEVWGDDLDLEEHEWDDGNSKDGDGWSSRWEIEQGFTCEGTYWHEIVKPSASVTSVSNLNIATVTFSEPVYFSENFTSHMKTNIDGPSSPYLYNVTILNADSYQLNKTYTEFQVSIHDVQATLYGNNREKIEIWFDNLSAVKDIAGNTLTEGKISGYLKMYEFIPPDVEASAEGGGKSMKYALISMFSVNMALKMIISSSAALMWSLIHVLQAFRYILMINIKMPAVISILMKYLGVVIGEVDEMEDLVPDVFNLYIINSSDISSEMVVPGTFENYGYETPYLTDLYGRQIFMSLSFIVLGMPTIYVLMKVFKNISIIYKKLYETWTGMFWNGPLRTFVELFIEISLGFFLNSLNIGFMTYSGIVATTIMFLAGFYITFFPFV